jgi:hypothetical protein
VSMRRDDGHGSLEGGAGLGLGRLDVSAIKPSLLPTSILSSALHASTTRLSGLDGYADELAALLASRRSNARDEGLIAALDGEVSRRLRACVPLEERRRDGAFFTRRGLADQLLVGQTQLIQASEVIADTACGAGDLLLAAARALPIASSVQQTLTLWGRRLVGRELNPVYVRTARLRLALLASARVGRAWRGDEKMLVELLPDIAVGDGMEFEVTDKKSLVLLNPPFGAVTATEPWGAGRVARAAVFTARIVERLPEGAVLRAVLPDVLRSGSNYRHWRSHIEERLHVERVEPVGQFDPWTDVDVFLLSGRASSGGGRVTWWPPASTELGCTTVGDHFEVRVGPVVPHRDRAIGDESPYLRAHDLPLHGEHRPGAVRRRHPGRRFKPPLVVVRRTSRPAHGRSRLTATLIAGSELVLVENHLIACVPRDGTLVTCQRLIAASADERTTAWLDQRLRCRHLTVSALRDVPLPDRPAGWPASKGLRTET